MPELPEVETMRRDLAESLEGNAIERARITKPDILMDGSDPVRFEAVLRDRRILRVERRGKNLLWNLAAGPGAPPSVLLVQVRMTGRFAVAPAGDPEGVALAALLGWRHIAARFRLDDGRSVLYDDVRRLGGFRLLESREWQRMAAQLGPEPLERGFTAAALGAALGRGRAPVKSALLDQRRVVGVGNIYASEALHRARVDPTRPCAALAADEIRRLHRGLRSVLREALRHSGTSLRDYRTVDGASGKFQERLRVYDREGRPCRRCGTPISRLIQAGRSTYCCRGCQT